MPAVCAEDYIVAAQIGADSGRDCFFADISMAGTGNQPHLMRARELLFCPPDEDHRSVEPQQLLAVQFKCIAVQCGVSSHSLTIDQISA